MRPNLIVLIAVMATFYGLGYGLARMRKFVVMQEYHVKEQASVVRQTGPGLDVRDDWRGRLKNRLNPVAFSFFRPLCWLEDLLRGSTRSVGGRQQSLRPTLDDAF